MLAFVVAEGRGQGDALLADVARALLAEGRRLAGVVQVNTIFDPARPCHMDLDVLTGGGRVRISQNLGPLAKGCRLDPSGLESAVGLVQAALEAAPSLLVINKFGKQELDGRGFRPLIGQALGMGVPVLTSVAPRNTPAFLEFAEGMAEALPPDEAAILAWCRAR